MHLSKPNLTSSSSTPPCKVVVLLLAPCHSFPGYGLLSELIEDTGCTVELYSPDCSPTSQIAPNTPDPSNLERSDDTDRLQHSSNAGAGAPVLSESKRFEADPALFTDPHGSFSTSWESAQFVLTFNSYMDNIWPALHSQGFTLVITSTIITSLSNSSCVMAA
jgi:hypothetical protein